MSLLLKVKCLSSVIPYQSLFCGHIPSDSEHHFIPTDDMEAIPAKQFVKHVGELYSNNQRGFAEDFEVHFKIKFPET